MKYFRIQYKQGKYRGLHVLEASNRLEATKQFSTLSLGVIQKVIEVPQPFSIRFEKFQEKWDYPIKKKPVNDLEYIVVLEQLYVMLDAGMPINISLEQAIEGTQNEMIKAIFTSILEDIEGGLSLTASAKKYTLQLGTLSISMFDLGEKTGTLSESIKRLADIIQEIYDNRIKLKKATRYPTFIIMAMAIAFTVVIIYVVPQFEDLFRSAKLELPFPTRLLLWLENALVSYGPYILGSAVLLAAMFTKMYNKSKNIRLKTDKFLLKIYIVGDVTYLAMIGRFVYIFDVLSAAGIPIIDALRTANGIVDNTYMHQQLSKVAEAIEDGKSLHQGFVETELFDSMPLQMLKAGEQSGSIDRMLTKMSKLFRDKYNYIIDNVATMIEPILITAIAGFVLLLALGIFLPMWSMVELAG
ncbi:MAG TPA: type II secretion system F family protein [Sulfurimonas sp.]|nr:type II secretion system F family protein [Sulfurimonas sp.]